MKKDTATVISVDHTFEKLPDHLLIEIFIRVPISEWAQISCVRKQWAALFRGECLWQTALIRTWPLAGQAKTMAWAYSSRSEQKEQLELSTMPPPSGILHGTMIDQFITCGKSRDKAHELASQIWLAVINNLEENERTFLLLKRLTQEGDLFLPYPYSRSYRVQWRVFEKLFTDFRDCFNCEDYYDVLACAKSNFQPIPSAWLGY